MFLQLRILFTLSLTAASIYLLLNLSNLVLKTALLVLAFKLADFFIKYVWSTLPSPKISHVRDKFVFITGCDSGFGNRLVRQLDANGVTVFAGCLFAEGPGALNLKKECSNNLHIVQIDVTKDEQVRAAVKYVTNTLNDKPLHALVNNAGIFSASEAEFIEIDELKRVLDVNTVGVARVTQAFLPLMRKSKGRIVITASLSSSEAIPFTGAYTMSKYAVLAYAKIIRRELIRWSVSVHTIEPGIYNTEMKNRELILSKIDKGFNHAPEETRWEYGGEEYMKAYCKAYDFADHLQSNRIEEVTDCMMDAIIAKHPKLRYIPGVCGKLQFWSAVSLPEELNDIFYHLLLKFFVGSFSGSWKKIE